MKPENERRFSVGWIVLLVASWPLIYYFRYLIPTRPHYLGIGNDFYSCYYVYKAYLLDFLSQGKIPLWSPAEGAGFPFYSSPLAQVFYPFNAVLAFFYRIFQGFTQFDYQVFTLLAIPIYSVGTFLWLNRLSGNIRSVLFATLSASMSYKLGELFRFPNAVHAAAWYPWILYGITAAFQARSFKEKLPGACVVFCSVILLITAAYPYFAFYSTFLVLPYLVFVSVPALWPTSLRGRFVGRTMSLGIVAVSGITALVVCAPYLTRMADLLARTSNRSGNSYGFSLFGSIRGSEIVANLIYPPFASAEGWYFFGVLSVVFVLFYLIEGFFLREKRLDKRSFNRDVGFKIFIVTWIALVTLVSCGDRSPVFRFLWENFPFFSSLRMWARINVLFVPIISLTLLVSFSRIEDWVFETRSKTRGMLLLAFSYGVIAVVQVNWLILGKTHQYWKLYVGTHRDTWSYAVFAGAAVIVFLAFVGWSSRKGSNIGKRNMMLTLCLALVTLELHRHGRDLWAVPTAWTERRPLHIADNFEKAFSAKRSDEVGVLSLYSEHHLAPLSNWHFTSYNQFLVAAQNDPDSYQKLLGIRDGQRLFFSKRLDHATPFEFLKDESKTLRKVTVVRYEGERLEAIVSPGHPGFLSFVDNWDPDWAVEIDGQAGRVEKLFGTFKAVHIPEGSHRVLFEYRPFGRRP